MLDAQLVHSIDPGQSESGPSHAREYQYCDFRNFMKGQECDDFTSGDKAAFHRIISIGMTCNDFTYINRVMYVDGRVVVLSSFCVRWIQWAGDFHWQNQKRMPKQVEMANCMAVLLSQFTRHLCLQHCYSSFCSPDGCLWQGRIRMRGTGGRRHDDIHTCANKSRNCVSKTSESHYHDTFSSYVHVRGTSSSWLALAITSKSGVGTSFESATVSRLPSDTWQRIHEYYPNARAEQSISLWVHLSISYPLMMIVAVRVRLHGTSETWMDPTKAAMAVSGEWAMLAWACNSYLLYSRRVCIR